MTFFVVLDVSSIVELGGAWVKPTNEMMSSAVMHRLGIALFVLAAVCGIRVASAAPLPAARGQGDERFKKASRTPAQQKIDAHLLYEIDRRQAQSPPAEPLRPTGVRIDENHRALVDVRADVTAKLQNTITALKGTIVSTSPKYRSIVAWIPLLRMEQLAADGQVTAITPLAEPASHR